MNLRAALGRVAVNALFVFMAQRNVRALRRLDQHAQALERRAAKRAFIHSLARIEAEQANVLRIQRVRHLERVQKAIAMRAEIVGHADFADGRADRPRDQPRVVQPRPQLLRARNRQIRHIRALHIANLQTV